jgi:hypothetical protein
MAHFAQLDENNKVIQVIVVDNDETHDKDGLENETLGVAFCKKLFGLNTKWVQTSYNRTIRGGVFAGIGMTYDETLDSFIPDTTGILEPEEQTSIEEPTND